MLLSDLPKHTIAKIFFEWETGCWWWLGASSRARKSRYSYGLIQKNGKLRYVHRAIYESLVGPIPSALQLDHLCRNTLCCNPMHLEPVNAKTNINRGRRFNAEKTHCKRGHEFTPENTYFHAKSGERKCRACKVLTQQAYMRRKSF